jgi:hypothetical protein
MLPPCGTLSNVEKKGEVDLALLYDQLLGTHTWYLDDIYGLIERGVGDFCILPPFLSLGCAVPHVSGGVGKSTCMHVRI